MSVRDHPTECAGCGLPNAVDPKAPARHETTFGVFEKRGGGIVYECLTCGTLTQVPEKNLTITDN